MMIRIRLLVNWLHTTRKWSSSPFTNTLKTGRSACNLDDTIALKSIDMRMNVKNVIGIGSG